MFTRTPPPAAKHIARMERARSQTAINIVKVDKHSKTVTSTRNVKKAVLAASVATTAVTATAAAATRSNPLLTSLSLHQHVHTKCSTVSDRSLNTKVLQAKSRDRSGETFKDAKDVMHNNKKVKIDQPRMTTDSRKLEQVSEKRSAFEHSRPPSKRKMAASVILQQATKENNRLQLSRSSAKGKIPVGSRLVQGPTTRSSQCPGTTVKGIVPVCNGRTTSKMLSSPYCNKRTPGNDSRRKVVQGTKTRPKTYINKISDEPQATTNDAPEHTRSHDIEHTDSTTAPKQSEVADSRLNRKEWKFLDERMDSQHYDDVFDWFTEVDHQVAAQR
jgi:hypothetical protein